MKLLIEVNLEEKRRSDDSVYLEVTSVKKNGKEIKADYDGDTFWDLLDDEGDINLSLVKQSL